MWGRRALQVKMVKTSSDETTAECTHLDPEQISTMAKDLVKYTAITIGAVYAGVKLFDTLNNIVLLKVAGKRR